MRSGCACGSSRRAGSRHWGDLGIGQAERGVGGRVAEAPDVDADVDDGGHVLGKELGDLAVDLERVVLAAQVVGEHGGAELAQYLCGPVLIIDGALARRRAAGAASS